MLNATAVATTSGVAMTCVCGWDVTPYGLVCIYIYMYIYICISFFTKPRYSVGDRTAVKTEAEDCSETSVTNLQSTRRQASEDYGLDTALRGADFSDKR